MGMLNPTANLTDRVPGMRFGTYYFFQAPPWLSHEEVVHRELEQFAWTEELGYDAIWLTEHHFIEYGLAVDPATLAAVAAPDGQSDRHSSCRKTAPIQTS